MTEALNRAPTGDSARGPGVDETPGPHPLTRRRPESSTSAHATSQASWFRFPRFSKSADNRLHGRLEAELVDGRGEILTGLPRVVVDHVGVSSFQLHLHPVHSRQPLQGCGNVRGSAVTQ